MYGSRHGAVISAESRLLEALASVEKETLTYTLGLELKLGAPELVLRQPLRWPGQNRLDRATPDNLAGTYSILQPEQYIATRLEPMLSYHIARARAAHRQRQRWWLGITLLAMTGASAAVALNAGASVIAILTTFAIAGLGALGILQPDRKEQVSLAIASALREVLERWNSLPAEKRAEQKSLDEAVSGTEAALRMDWQVGFGKPFTRSSIISEGVADAV